MNKFLWIQRHRWSYHIIKEWYDQGSFITDDTYEIPSKIAHLSDEDIDKMLDFNILDIYGIEDDKGYCHVNKADFERYLAYAERKEGIREIDSRRRKNKLISIVIMDYKSPEEDKRTFFKRVLK